VYDMSTTIASYSTSACILQYRTYLNVQNQ
jgi:hypothetical protein